MSSLGGPGLTRTVPAAGVGVGAGVEGEEGEWGHVRRGRKGSGGEKNGGIRRGGGERSGLGRGDSQGWCFTLPAPWHQPLGGRTGKVTPGQTTPPSRARRACRPAPPNPDDPAGTLRATHLALAEQVQAAALGPDIKGGAHRGPAGADLPGPEPGPEAAQTSCAQHRAPHLPSAARPGEP